MDSKKSDDYGQYESSGAPLVPTPAEIADRYQFIDKLGGGTQGNVYKALRLSDQKIVAIKRLRINSVNTWKEYDLFHREAEVLASISEHGVAEFYEAIECLSADPPSAYIVQELIEGRSLQIMLKTGFRFTVSRIFKMALGLIELLERLHSHEPPIIHRDIKPNNIIMKPLADMDDFEPYLIDFGAVANPTVQKGGSTVAGTYGYMPPEQLVGHPCPASDIYSLGVTIVYMLCGVDPKDMMAADFRLVIDPYLENVPRPIVSVLHQMLAPKPENRLCDYSRLKYIFEQFANDKYAFVEDENQLPAELIEQNLAQVNAFNQAGNLDLWMQLSEVVPRSVPRNFADAILTTEAKDELVRAKSGLFIKIFLPLVLTCAAVLLFVNEMYFLGGVAAIVTCVFYVQMFATLSKLRKLHKDVDGRLLEYEKCMTPEEVSVLCGWDNIGDAPFLTLLKFGRKAIATIIDFEDIPVSEKYRECIQSNYNDNGRVFAARTMVSKSRVPFRLRYRFNPPDDASADDLVHENIIYNHQTEGLEPGTPIPILYYINPRDNSDVMSMPYPFPFKEIQQSQISLFNKDNLYGHTQGVR